MQGPEGFLVLAGQHSKRLVLVTQRRHRSVLVAIGPKSVGEGHRVFGIGLASGLSESLAVSGHSSRIEGVDSEPGFFQRSDQ